MGSTELDILVALGPHILTPVGFMMFFALPPFPQRRILFSLFTITMAHQCLFTTFPVHGTIPTPLLGFISMWQFYLGWLAMMLLHDPEHDFWRVGRRPHEAETMPFGLAKLGWALGLLSSWRGVGWNFQQARLPKPRPRIGRWRFVAQETVRAAAYFVAADALLTFVRAHHFRQASDSVEQLGLIKRSALEAAVGAKVWFQSEYLFASYGAASVALGLYKEEDFIPIFGSIIAVHSLAGFWGRFWHQNSRFTFTEYSRAIASILKIPHRSFAYLLVHILTAFFISAVMHGVAVWCLPAVEPFNTFYDTFMSFFIFFVLQAVGLIMERAFWILPGEDILLYEVGRYDVWVMGRLWTLSWLLFSGKFVLNTILKTEMGLEESPVRIVARILKWCDI